jgi:hypothetical protein
VSMSITVQLNSGKIIRYSNSSGTGWLPTADQNWYSEEYLSIYRTLSAVGFCAGSSALSGVPIVNVFSLLKKERGL